MAITVIMWDIATGNQGGRGLPRFVGAMNSPVVGFVYRGQNQCGIQTKQILKRYIKYLNYSQNQAFVKGKIYLQNVSPAHRYRTKSETCLEGSYLHIASPIIE